MGLYDIEKAEEIIGVPEGQLLMSLVAVGYPDEEPAVPKKKTVEDLLSWR
jgi:nitroreductase